MISIVFFHLVEFGGSDDAEQQEDNSVSGEDLIVRKGFIITSSFRVFISRRNGIVVQLKKKNVKFDKLKSKKNVKKHDRKYVIRCVWIPESLVFSKELIFDIGIFVFFLLSIISRRRMNQ
jgi:hypothetical protein